MTHFEYGNPKSTNVLIQMVDDHDLSVIENEVNVVKEKAGNDFCLIAVKVDDWNRDLSPWRAPAVFGGEAFGGGAEKTLAKVISELNDQRKKYYIGGYSLAGLFALWAAYQTDVFKGVAAASPSVWFPGFTEYMDEHVIKSRTVYLSLGDRESKARNPVTATVGERIQRAYSTLTGRGINCILEWNEGNHFRDADKRTAKAFAWVMKNSL